MSRKIVRSPENEKVSISLPKKLLKAVEAIAEREHRSRSGQICYMLEREISNNLVIAEDSSTYGNDKADGERNGKAV